MLKGKIRVFTWFRPSEKSGYNKEVAYLKSYVLISLNQYDKTTEKVMLYNIANIGGYAVDGVSNDIIGVSFKNFYHRRVAFLSELQRFAQDEGYALECEPIEKL